MALIGIQDKDSLDGASNYYIQKARMTFLLDEHGLKTYAKRFIAVPTNLQQIENYRKDMAKGKQLMLDGIQDHKVSHLATKNTTKEMWDVIATLFQNPSEN